MISYFQLLILIDREIEAAQQINPDYNSYEKAEKLFEDLSKKQNELKERLGRSQTTDEVRSTLSEYLEYEKFLHLEAPRDDVAENIMLRLCLCRILKTNIEFYNSQISEDQIFEILSEMRIERVKNEIELQHPFWSLKVRPVSSTVASKSTENLIIDTKRGTILERNREITTNILSNTEVDDLTTITDGAGGGLFTVEVTDKLAALKTTGVISSVNLEDIKAISGILSTNYITELKRINLKDLKLSCSMDDDAVKSLLSICSETTSVDNLQGKFIPHVRSRRLEIINLELSDSDTEELVTAMRDRVETVEMRSSVTLDTDSMARYLTSIEGESKCRSLLIPDRYKQQVPAWRDILKNNENISIMFMTEQQANDKAQKIREAGEKHQGYYPTSLADIREAVDLVNTRYLTALKCLRLERLDLSPSDETDIKSLLSVCTDCVCIVNVRGCDLIIKHVKSKELKIKDQTLSASETADLVISMRDRVERAELKRDVSIDEETVDSMIGELRQGTCREIECWYNTSDKYRDHLNRWANTIGWKTVKETYRRPLGLYVPDKYKYWPEAQEFTGVCIKIGCEEYKDQVEDSKQTRNQKIRIIRDSIFNALCLANGGGVPLQLRPGEDKATQTAVSQ